MALLFHLSDLHFGPRFNAHLSELVLADVGAAKPDLTIISGDFTMRARRSEYEQARAYLQRLPGPVFTIPGNHDQPLSAATIAERLTSPWKRYKQYINPNIDLTCELPGLFVVGINDNHPVLPGGIWSASQRRWIKQVVANAAPSACRILVMHHQLNWNGRIRPFGQWFPARHLTWLRNLGFELVLNGHVHVPVTVRSEQGVVVAQSGTAMSTRTRHGYGNSYNQIMISADAIQVRVMEYDPSSDSFVPRKLHSFGRMRSIGAQEMQT